MRNTARLLAALAGIALFGSLPASAQHLYRVDLFGGYSYMRYDSTTLGFRNDSNLNGGNVSIAWPSIYRGLGFVADASGNFGDELRIYNFMIGPQFSYRKFGFTFFGHGLYGKSRGRFDLPHQDIYGVHYSAYSSLGRDYAYGGGVDKPFLKPHLSLRIQVDYITSDTFGTTQSNIRASTGIVYRWGKK